MSRITEMLIIKGKISVKTKRKSEIKSYICEKINKIRKNKVELTNIKSESIYRKTHIHQLLDMRKNTVTSYMIVNLTLWTKYQMSLKKK